MRVSQSGLDDARKALLVNMIESYFGLTAVETERYRQLDSRKEFQKMEDTELTELTWAGKIELKAKSDTLLKQLTKKFGPLSDTMTERVRALDSLEEMDSYLERVITANSLGDMELG